jgi:glucose dehydrogenase
VVGAGGGNQEGTPLVWNNTLYGITTWSVVYALDARTGKELWRWDPEVNQTAVRPKICCGIVNRGMALYNGTLIAAINTSDYLLVQDIVLVVSVGVVLINFLFDFTVNLIDPRISRE